MRFNTVIYIRYLPLTLKIYKDFYMEEVKMAGINVEYWDITALFFKEDFGQEDSSELANTRKFTSYAEIENALSLAQPLNDKLFVSIMTFEGRINKLYQILTKFNCTLSVFGRNMFPISAQNRKSIPFLLEKLSVEKINTFLRTKNIIKKKKQGLIKPYDIMFLGGTKGWQGIGVIEESEVNKAEVVKVNSDDYDSFLSLKSSLSVVDQDYILFLDEYLPLHPDTLLFKIKNVTAEQYYPELNNYLEKVEKQFGMPVVIAAHPKAIRYKTEDFFNGRQVYFDKTVQLSAHAQFVIAHDTTSINYPVAFGKKLHFITSTNIYNRINMVHRNTANFANFLGCNLQWFDKNEPINLIAELPEDNYRRYKYEFQTSPETEYTLTKDIFINFLKS